MERLTEWYDDGEHKGVMVKEQFGDKVLRTLFDELDEGYVGMCQLKAYEDTGLTPSEIMELKERDTAKAHAEVSEEHGYFECPSCGELIYTTDDLKSYKFCLNCGRRLKFKED